MHLLPIVRPRVYLEILGGKHDGLLLDSLSGDATERELVAQLLHSPNFVEVERLDWNSEAWVQLRHRE